MSATETLAGVEHYAEDFARVESRNAPGKRAWVQAIRQNAFNKFQDLGFPTVRDERWRKTNLKSVAETPYRHAAELFHDGKSDYERDERVERAKALAVKASDGPRMIFINGRFQPALSDVQGLPSGVKAISLSEAFDSERALLEPHYGKVAMIEDMALTALNLAFAEDGAFLHIPKDTILEQPIQIIHVSTDADAPAVCYPRNLIVIERSAQATILERYIGLENAAYFTNAVTEIVVCANAALDHYRVNDESRKAVHLCSFFGNLHRDATFTTRLITTGGRLTRNDFGARMLGEGIHCQMDGLFLTGDGQHVDNHSLLDHAAPNCSSHELFKGILDGKSSGVFTGKIIVRPGAQKTDAIQASRNMILSREAIMNPEPQLEIFADDVKCTHGATVGQIDQDSIFYLRARGIDEQAARGLLTYAFANEVIEQIKIDTLREELEGLIHARYRHSK